MIHVPATALLLLALLAPATARANADTTATLEISGWAELTLQKFDRTREDGGLSHLVPRADFLRAEIEMNRRLDAEFSVKAEIEFEHGGVAEDEVPIAVDPASGHGNANLGGEVSLEEAYLEWSRHRAFGARAGQLSVPVGLLNEAHEPGDFLGSLRNDVERRIIPTTWTALGVGVFGELGHGISYRACLLEGLDASRFTAEQAIREGRQHGSSANATHPALVARIDWRRAGLGLGGSLYSGDAWQGEVPAGRTLHVRVTLQEAHTTLAWRGLQARAFYVMGTISDHAELSRQLGVANTSDAIGSRFFGGRAEAGYDVLPIAYPGTKRSLVAFAATDLSDTQDGVGPIGSEDPSRHWNTLTIGMSFKPRPDIVIKADRRRRHNETRTQAGEWNMALGYEF